MKTDRELIESAATANGWTLKRIFDDAYRRNGQIMRVGYSEAGRITILRINGKSVARDRRATAIAKLREPK